MTVRPDHPFAVHAHECDDCHGARQAIDALAARLDAGGGAPDVRRLSRLALARAVPELQARARAVFWRRLARTLGAALVPLPLVLAADLWWLGRVYDIATAWLPAGLAADFVLSYAVALLALISSAYAAIPLLLARPVHAREAAAAAV